MKKDPVKPIETDAQIRSNGFDEVVSVYSEQQALDEASRCLQCKNPSCSQGCPVGIDIKKFITEIVNKDYKAAYLTIKEKNNFPSICGRVCPAEYQCRKSCVFTKKGEPFASAKAINIHFLERFAADFGLKGDIAFHGHKDKSLSCFKAAVIGSGPAGLSCAGELARTGVKVTIFEALHKPGGVLRYGIPSFRLPQDVLDFEIRYLNKLGVELQCNIIAGKTVTMDELFKQGFDAVFLGLGAGVPSFLNIPGENLCNVYSANEFLTRVNLMGAYKFPDYHTPVNVGSHIIIIGGGNTAMDAARVALRLQKINGITPDVSVLYRRTENEMPARRLEIHHAKEEGIRFDFLIQPVEFAGDRTKGNVKFIKCRRCRLGEPDKTGRPRPVPIEGSEFTLDCDQAVIAVGLMANQVLIQATPDLRIDKYSDIVVDPATMMTSIDAVYAGGDVVGGEGTVIEAMGMAKKAAAAIIKRFREKAR
ncbi:MAG: NADPH-dependent glutamate synthase [Candidatus Omnitrophota bacterium]|jgi:glutamate synthase (NADPH/NADH) small chain